MLFNETARPQAAFRAGARRPAGRLVAGNCWRLSQLREFFRGYRMLTELYRPGENDAPTLSYRP
jgi:hypothetical protein